MFGHKLASCVPNRHSASPSPTVQAATLYIPAVVIDSFKGSWTPVIEVVEAPWLSLGIRDTMPTGPIAEAVNWTGADRSLVLVYVS